MCTFLITRIEQQALVSAVRQALTSSCLSGFDRSFLLRMYGNGNLDRYRQRLQSLGLTGYQHVLDVGCGFAQWSIALSESNHSVLGIDCDLPRVTFASTIAELLHIKHLSFAQSYMETCHSLSNQYDLIFSYGAVPMSPYIQTLTTFYRLLAPGGTLYFSAYGLGHMINNILTPRNASAQFCPREWAIKAIDSTVDYLHTGNYRQSSSLDSLFLPSSIAQQTLHELGFTNIRIFPEGTFSTDPQITPVPMAPSFYNDTYEAVYEVICNKPSYSK